MVSDTLVRKLQTILKEKYGKDLSFVETARIANDLVDIFDILAQIKFKEMNKKKKS